MLFPCWTALKQSAKPVPRVFCLCAQPQRPTAESRKSPKSLLQVWNKLFRREKNIYFHASISPCHMSKRWQINLQNGTTTFMAPPSLTRKSSLWALLGSGWEENNRGTVGCPCHSAGLWLSTAIAEEMRGLWIKSCFFLLKATNHPYSEWWRGKPPDVQLCLPGKTLPVGAHFPTQLNLCPF